jgi:hypothetical protein
VPKVVRFEEIEVRVVIDKGVHFFCVDYTDRGWRSGWVEVIATAVPGELVREGVEIDMRVVFPEPRETED